MRRFEAEGENVAEDIPSDTELRGELATLIRHNADEIAAKLECEYALSYPNSPVFQLHNVEPLPSASHRSHCFPMRQPRPSARKLW